MIGYTPYFTGDWCLHIRRNRIRIALFLAVAGMLLFQSSCTRMMVRTRSMLGDSLAIDVTIDEHANRDTPVAMDLLVIYDEDLLSQLLKLTAMEWYENRDQIRKDHLQDTGLEIWEWEWTPGQIVGEIELPLRPKAEGGLVFVRYLSSGAHRFRIDPFSDLMIRFYEDHVTVDPMD